MVLVAGYYLALGLAFPHGLGLGDPSSWLDWATLTTSVLAGWGLPALVLLVRHGTRPDGGVGTGRSPSAPGSASAAVHRQSANEELPLRASVHPWARLTRVKALHVRTERYVVLH